MTPRRLLRLTGFTVAAALLGVACGDASDSSGTAPQPTTQPAPATAAATDSETSAASVPDILAFSSPLVGGGQFDGAELSDKPTALWFWSPT